MISDDVDALLIESFGAPESPDEVMPYLERVTSGRGIPAERLATVAQQYVELGGVSPLNAANRDLASRLRSLAPPHWIGERVYLGYRNSPPFIADTLSQMASDGVRRAAVFITSAFSSYSGCRMYRENLAAGLEESQAAVDLTVLPRFFDRVEMADIWADRIRDVWPQGKSHLIFVTHSIPTAGAQKYVPQHENLASRIVAELEGSDEPIDWELTYQSRSGSPATPWLEPDISDAISSLATRRPEVTNVVVAPIGFCAPNLEIAWDLDRLAAQAAEDAGLQYMRAEPPQSDPRFVTMIQAMLARETATPCALDCCPNPRGPRAAVR